MIVRHRKRLIVADYYLLQQNPMRHVPTARLLAHGLLCGLFAAGKLLPPFIWIAALYPGMLFAQALFSVLPVSTIDELIGDADNGPAAFAGMSVLCAFVFWWACAFMLLKT